MAQNWKPESWKEHEARHLPHYEDAAELAQAESELSKTAVLPSHVQVTRSKNISKLKKWPALKALLKPNEN